ncbi:hypothetical protein RFI_09281, partial [Reticulomyxa filosa]
SGETIAQLRNQLRYMHLQIVSTLTNSYEKTLLTQSSFDMRSIFGNTDKMLLDHLADECDKTCCMCVNFIYVLIPFCCCCCCCNTNRNPTYLFNAYFPLELSKNVRDETGEIIKNSKKSIKDEWRKKMLYGVLFINGHIITITQPKKVPVHHEDVIFLVHIVRYSESFKQSEAWFPVCLPHFEPTGFVYAYVSYLFNESDICLVLLTLDNGSFHNCQQLRHRIEIGLKQSNLIESLRAAVQSHPLKCQELITSSLKISHPPVFQFYYHNTRKHQYICPVPFQLFNSEPGRIKLFRRLEHIYDRLHSNPDHTVLFFFFFFLSSAHIIAFMHFEKSSEDTIVAKLVPNEFELVIIMNSFTSKKDAANLISKLVTYISQRSGYFFLNPVHW